MRVFGAARAALDALPRGALAVGGGLLVLGMTSYGFLLISAHNLTPRAFASLSVLYVLVYTAGPGVFLPFEQEVGRALADRRVRGLGGGPVLRKALLLATAVLVVLVLAMGAAGSAITQRLFDGSWLLFAGLLLSLVGLWAAHLSRGSFAGTGQFAAYGTELAVEGLSRLGACVVLAALGIHAVGAYGLLFGGAFIVSVLVVVARSVRGASVPGPAARWDELTSAIGWLVLGSLLAQVLVNAGPVAVKLLASANDKQAAGQLLAGLVLARLPLFLFAAVQAALLPRLAALVGSGELIQFWMGVRRLLLMVAGFAAVTVGLLGAAGPLVLHALFGNKFNLGRGDLALLSVATGLFMAANVLGNALLALQRFGMAASGWATGVGVLAVVIAVPSRLFARVEWSFAAGAAGSVVAFAFLLRMAIHRRTATVPHAASISDVVLGP